MGPTQWAMEALSPGLSGRGMKLTTPPSGAEVKNGESIPPLPHTSSCCDYLIKAYG
jgi:hypothetical protein